MLRMNKDQRDTNKYDRACMRLKLGGYLKHIKTCCALQLKKHGKSKTCQSIRLPSLGMNGYFVDFFNSRIGGLWCTHGSTRQATSWKARQASVPERPGFGSEKGESLPQ